MELDFQSSGFEHIPVLAETLAGQIILPKDGVVVDATVGQGGHSYLFGQFLGPTGAVVGLDVDQNSIQTAAKKLAGLKCKVFLENVNFAHIGDVLNKLEINKVDMILADLGFCSAQLIDQRVGISFQENQPLDMRLDKSLKVTAADIINKYDEKSLADLIYRFGQERASRRIARFVVQQRKASPIQTTAQLAALIVRVLGRYEPNRKKRIHPATRTFQALRIAVNHELENLEKLLQDAPSFLKPDARIAIISFHSLEDRIVKNDFRQKAAEGIYSISTKKPLTPTEEEIVQNRRARSAKLRIAKKL